MQFITINLYSAALGFIISSLETGSNYRSLEEMSYLDTAKCLSQDTRFYKRGFKTLITSWSPNLGTLSFLSCAVSHRWSSVQLLERMLWDWGCCPCLPCVTPGSLCHLKTVTQCHLRCHWVTKASADMVLPFSTGSCGQTGPPEMSQRVLGAFFRRLKQLQFPKQGQLCGKGLMLDGRSSELSLKLFVPLVLSPGPYKSPEASYGWNSHAGTRVFGPKEGWMDAPTFLESPPDGARV